MRHFRFLGSGLLTLALLVGSAIAQTGTVTTLYNFDITTGTAPNALPVFDTGGQSLRDDCAGGKFGLGTIFELTPNQDGTWSEKVVHDLRLGHDGSNASHGADLGRKHLLRHHDGRRNTWRRHRLQLTDNGDGTWTETTIWNFAGGLPTDGSLCWRSRSTARRIFGARRRAAANSTAAPSSS
jgi:hypothetical protein